MSSTETAIQHNEQNDLELMVEDDRRDGSRVKVLKHVRITGADGTHPSELGTVIDLTREGMYFTVRSLRFSVGTELQLAFPDTGSECTGVAVRVEQLPDGRQGVGVRILNW